MDVYDDDEYINAAAAHAAFVMIVSAAIIRYMNLHFTYLLTCVEVW